VIRTIPLSLLIHEVTYEEYLENERYGETYAQPVTLKKVRMEPVLSQQQRTSATVREQSIDRYILFFDMTHSEPKVQFKEKSKVTFNDQTYIVSKVSEVYDFSTTPHHIEVMLA
jgi:hypothetical protein